LEDERDDGEETGRSLSEIMRNPSLLSLGPLFGVAHIFGLIYRQKRGWNHALIASHCQLVLSSTSRHWEHMLSLTELNKVEAGQGHKHTA
jgi:hypothetical protein